MNVPGKRAPYPHWGIAGVIEPARVKRQAIQSAAETAVLLIRVDDMMITQSRPPAGMPGGM